MSLFDSIFGAGAQQSMLGSQQQANQVYQGQAGLANQQSLSQAFNQTMMNWNQNPFANQSPHRWVFNNKPCTLHEFADSIWGPEEHEDKMLFLLTHSGPKQE